MKSQAYPLQSENFFDETELIKKETQRLVYERFCVIAKDAVDGSYYVGRILPNADQPDYFYWCNACQQLNLRILVNGYLSESIDMKSIPLLVIK
ncbi:hypothetical protein WA1_23335 [Scytonema hofmannii PCC 7110]|jgi:hypothetical protein|uniref:Uncharacterized protein n=1 Tax=Scytonema hofmannii PCC 7110 TaxID=128403 RepID=A0A139X8U7_9CYAN|nr:hypothetical protein [Scytonema hofmannii]KYC41053.1 hypothetical protein WA1_23335 [Scytonema hofmannii PCC 7110]